MHFPLSVLRWRHVVVAAAVLLMAAPVAAQTETVLHARNASRLMGDWQLVGDTTAAGGTRIWNPDRGAGKVASASANPYDYFELTFTAEAGRPYRLWIRGRADNDHWANDSVFVQFSGAVNASGGAAYRIGTSAAATFSVEECNGCGSSRWGWNDNGWNGLGPAIYFATTGPQTIRIQRREDGVSIDQIVLSASRYATTSPGLLQYDATLLAATVTTTAATTSSTSAAEVIIPVASVASLRGDWQVVSDTTAATGRRVTNPDRGAGKLTAAAAAPGDYFDVTFNAEAGRGYRLWIRGQAQNDTWTNDSVFVQFDRSLNAAGAAAYRIGTTGAATVSIEQGNGQGVARWGWSDNGWDADGTLIYFDASGPQRLRVQRREDGVSIDQIVLSSQKYLATAPGAAKFDATILTGSTTTAVTEATSSPVPTTTTAPSTTTPTSTQPALTGSTTRLRVLMWNLGHGRGTDGVYNIDRIATWMARMTPDVVVLVEVEKYTWFGNEDQPARYKAMLEAKTGKRWYSHFSQEFGQWSSNGKGLQILSIYPFDSAGHTTITPSSGLNWAGAASQATITVNGRTLNFVHTHLDPYDQAMRLTQAREVLRWAAGFAENRLVTGDMNAWPDQTSIAEINKTYNDSWAVALNKGAASAPADITPYGATRKGRIDYIFYSKASPDLTVVDAKVWETRDASGYMPSDHRPVVVTFEVR